MSAGNWFKTRREAFLNKTIAVEGLDVVTSSVRVGTSSDDFIVDRVVNVTCIASGGSMTLNVPDGIYPGQRLLVNFIAITGVDGGQTVDVTLATAPETVTHPPVYQLGAPVDYVTLEWIDSNTGWINWNNQIT